MNRLKSVGAFILHQFLGTWGIAFTSYQLLALASAIITQKEEPAPFVHWILTTPIFPVQIALGLCIGWYLQRGRKDALMTRIWIIPAIILASAFIANFDLRFPHLSVGNDGNRLSRYFGAACNLRKGCFTQLEITMPFYASAAYSIGAWLSLRSKQATPRADALDGG